MVDYVQYCPIWGEPYEASGYLRPEIRTYEVSESARAGNGYKIDEVLLNSSVRLLAPDEMERLATWLVDQRIQAVRIPEITQATIDYVKQKRSLQVHERAERLLVHLARRSTSAGQLVDIGAEGDRDSFGDGSKVTLQPLGGQWLAQSHHNGKKFVSSSNIWQNRAGY